LIEYQDFTAPFSKLIGKRADFPLGEIEIIQVDIQN
jgi:hypothetical protein